MVVRHKFSVVWKLIPSFRPVHPRAAVFVSTAHLRSVELAIGARNASGQSRMRRAVPLLVIFVALIASPVFSAGDDVVVTLHDGLAGITARDAAVSDVLEAWSRAGGTTIVNGELLRSARLTLQVVDMPEEQALDVVLRSAIGYVARRRSSPSLRRLGLRSRDRAAPYRCSGAGFALTPTPASAVPLTLPPRRRRRAFDWT